MQPNSATSAASGMVDVAPADSGGMVRGLLAGLVPVVLLLVIAALTVAAAFIVRLATSAQGFDTQQTLAVSVVGVGLAVAFVVYAIGCVRVLHRVGAWQRAGASALAAGALWGLGIGALIVVLPLILGALIPQHPAPLLP